MAGDPQRFSEARTRMLEGLARRHITDRRVLAAFAAVPRERFVAIDQLGDAYADRPLTIGFDQTISQPLVVAIAAQLLALRGGERVLEVGGGCGYAAAIFAHLAAPGMVHTIERIPQLAELARDRLASLAITNVSVHCADGTLGWPPAAPYDAICVSAAAVRTPPALIEQLAPAGRLVIPLGSADRQRLVRLTRSAATSDIIEQDFGDVRFVPLVGADR